MSTISSYGVCQVSEKGMVKSIPANGGLTNITASPDFCFKGMYCIKDLLAERSGYAMNVTGGLGGRIYFVNTTEDDPANPRPGMLRHAVSLDEPIWIFFLVNGTIYLRAPIYVKSNKTIDGRGARITITDNTVFVRDVQNVIVVNIRFDSVRKINVDGMEIRRSTLVWIHHCDFTNWSDGALDIPEAIKDRPTLVTISWCRFWNTDKTILIGNSGSRTTDANFRITMHHNYFFQTRERHPRIRHGVVDYYNNYIYDALVYYLGGTYNGTIHAEANIFEFRATPTKILLYCNLSNEPPMNVILKNNLVIPQDIEWVALGGCRINTTAYVRPYPADVEPATEELKLKIMRYAGTDFAILPRILVDHPQSFTEDYRWEVPLPYNTPSLNVGFAIDVTPYRNPEDEVTEILFYPGNGAMYILNPGNKQMVYIENGQQEIVNLSDPTITSPGYGFRVRHTYEAPGVYTVVAIVKTKGGKQYFIYGTVFVNITFVNAGAQEVIELQPITLTLTETATKTFIKTDTVAIIRTVEKTITLTNMLTTTIKEPITTTVYTYTTEKTVENPVNITLTKTQVIERTVTSVPTEYLTSSTWMGVVWGIAIVIAVIVIIIILFVIKILK